MSDASGIAGADAKLWGLDRTLTRLMGGAGLALLLSWLLIDVIFGLHPYVSWWIWGHGLLAALFVVAVLSPSRVLTARTLKTLWVLIPAIGITLQITAFLAERSSDDAEVPGEATIWQVTWMLTAVYLSLLTMLLARAGDATTAHLLVRVNLIAAALALAPALSVWVEYGKLTPGLVSVTVVQFGNVSFAILLVLFRARMVPCCCCGSAMRGIGSRRRRPSSAPARVVNAAAARGARSAPSWPIPLALCRFRCATSSPRPGMRSSPSPPCCVLGRRAEERPTGCARRPRRSRSETRSCRCARRLRHPRWKTACVPTCSPGCR